MKKKDDANEVVQELTRETNYTLAFGMGFATFLGIVYFAYDGTAGYVNVGKYTDVIAVLTVLMLNVYVMELFTYGGATPLTILHHFITFADSIYILIFTDDPYEITMGFILLGYVFAEVNIYVSLMFHYLHKLNSVSRRAAGIATRVSVIVQLLCILVAQVLLIAFFAVNHAVFRPLFTTIFLVGDIFLVLEQLYTINRSCVSVTSKLGSNSFVEKGLLKGTNWIAGLVKKGGKKTRKTRGAD